MRPGVLGDDYTYLVVSIHASVKDATLCRLQNIKAPCSFNPRICKRCDIHFFTSSFDIEVSIHASVKDATSQTHEGFSFHAVSIHASVKDATRLEAIRKGGSQVSIHASVKDATSGI